MQKINNDYKSIFQTVKYVLNLRWYKIQFPDSSFFHHFMPVVCKLFPSIINCCSTDGKKYCNTQTIENEY